MNGSRFLGGEGTVFGRNTAPGLFVSIGLEQKANLVASPVEARTDRFTCRSLSWKSYHNLLGSDSCTLVAFHSLYGFVFWWSRDVQHAQRSGVGVEEGFLLSH